MNDLEREDCRLNIRRAVRYAGRCTRNVSFHLARIDRLEKIYKRARFCKKYEIFAVQRVEIDKASFWSDRHELAYEYLMTGLPLRNEDFWGWMIARLNAKRATAAKEKT